MLKRYPLFTVSVGVGVGTFVYQILIGNFDIYRALFVCISTFFILSICQFFKNRMAG